MRIHGRAVTEAVCEAWGLDPGGVQNVAITMDYAAGQPFTGQATVTVELDEELLRSIYHRAWEIRDGKQVTA